MQLQDHMIAAKHQGNVATPTTAMPIDDCDFLNSANGG